MCHLIHAVSHLAERFTPSPRDGDARRSMAVRRLLVLALVLAGCGGAAAHRPEASAQGRRLPALRADEHCADAVGVCRRSTATGWACTVFFGAGGDPILGRNFDFHDEPALLLRHHPPGAYASISMVDISYLGFDRAPSRADLRRGPEGRRGDPVRRHEREGRGGRDGGRARRPVRAGRATGSLGVMRLVLDRAASVGRGGGDLPPHGGRLHRRAAAALHGRRRERGERGRRVRRRPRRACSARRAAVAGDDELRPDRRPRRRRPLPDREGRAGALARPPDPGVDARAAAGRPPADHPLVGRLRPARAGRARRDGPEVRRPRAHVRGVRRRDRCRAARAQRDAPVTLD